LIDSPQPKKPDDIHAFGRIAYAADIEGKVNSQSKDTTKTVAMTKSGATYFKTLDDKEIWHLAQIAKTKGLVCRLDTAYFGSEERFKAMGKLEKSPSVLLVSTHGFYQPYEKNNRDSTGAAQIAQQPDALRRSGLVLAGGNYYWQYGSNFDNLQENGILTADEIAQCNFKQTDLVVLSACETGLGDVSGEGVFGLQRGFKQAGAKSILMSLWKVDNAATSEMMTLFFEQYLKDGDARAAFDLAQATMKEKYANSPYIWASFVLLD
jgi:CHAT domain-containing protein